MVCIVEHESIAMLSATMIFNGGKMVLFVLSFSDPLYRAQAEKYGQTVLQKALTSRSLDLIIMEGTSCGRLPISRKDHAWYIY